MGSQILITPSSTPPSHQPAMSGQQSNNNSQGSTRTTSKTGVRNADKIQSGGSNMLIRPGKNDGVLNRLLLLVSAAESTANMYHTVRSASIGALDSLTKSTHLTLENESVAGHTVTSLTFPKYISKSESKCSFLTLEDGSTEGEVDTEKKEISKVFRKDVGRDVLKVMKERDEMKSKIEKLESTMNNLVALRDYKTDYERLAEENRHLNASIDALIAAQADNNNETTKNLTTLKQFLNRIPTFTSAFACGMKPMNMSCDVSRNVASLFHCRRTSSEQVVLAEARIISEDPTQVPTQAICTQI